MPSIPQTLSFAYTSQHGPPRKTHLFHFCGPAVVLLRISCLAMGTCFLSRCPETTLVYLPISQLLHATGHYSETNLFSTFYFKQNYLCILFCLLQRFFSQLHLLSYF
jgi:hypothetical protein